MIDLKTFEFPEVKGVDMAFPTLETIPELLEEAKERGFYNGQTEYNELFSEVFFNGKKIKFKDGLTEDFKVKAWSYACAFMGSSQPKHEEKDAICAMLMSELLVISEE